MTEFRTITGAFPRQWGEVLSIILSAPIYQRAGMLPSSMVFEGWARFAWLHGRNCSVGGSSQVSL